ncbi:MAG: Inorganic Pyrophosphatase [Candidatus Parcubacteria bacterium]|jgi:hypothetical protein
MQKNNSTYAGLSIVIENPKGTYKSFQTEGDATWNSYPLKGVTYPVDYGYIEGYTAEDEADLDVFIGTGKLCGFIQVWRLDVPIETKMVANVTDGEWQAILDAFAPVLREQKQFETEADFVTFIEKFKNKK